MLALILKWLGGGVLDRVLSHLEAQANTQTERERIRTQVTIEEVKAEIERRHTQADVVKAELGHPVAWFPRLLASLTAVFVLMTFVVRWLWFPGTPLAELDPWVAGVIGTIFAGMFITGR